MRGVDGAAVGKLSSYAGAVGKLSSYAGDCGPFVCEWRVGGNEVSSCAGVKDSRGFLRGGGII